MPTGGDVAKILEFYKSQGVMIEASLLVDLPKLREAAQRASGTVHKTADRLKEHEAEIERAKRSTAELLRQKTEECQAEAERADRAESGAEEATARLRRQLDNATNYIRESEALIVEQGLRIKAQEEELESRRAEVKVLRRQVRQLSEEASEPSVAGDATQVRPLVGAVVNYRPFDPRIYGPGRPRPTFDPDSSSLLDLSTNTPAAIPDRPTVADRVLQHVLRLVVPSQVVGFCGALFHSAMNAGMLPGPSLVAGLVFAVVGSGVLWLTYKWFLRRNRIALPSVALLIGCTALSVSGYSIALHPALAGIAKEDGTQWAEEFDRLPCNDGTSICPTWIRNS
ncbi:hypothetical protein [Streptomyces sp. NBC_01294]|uniref:hypothetical protein n=1 Tax=Streptomyces sp. NBC_01294 TaxID=2903815 RepID=UPI002DDA29EB|nr:hypothetical protein [Streptomyces sp. NBC_01294]WRZ62311.1 hypothetical protein OG534_38280 [Streptomyces sp. NBC_01294]